MKKLRWLFRLVKVFLSNEKETDIDWKNLGPHVKVNLHPLRRSTDIKEIRCYECDYPIQGNDDAKVCTVCGGMNLRCNYGFEVDNAKHS